jgi:uracil-DNA glycosylase
MTLYLDERRLAMLEQFGIRLPADARTAPVDERTEARTEPEPAPRASGIELMEWDALADAVSSCRACNLCATRRNTVFGVGDLQADWLFVGEPPGEDEELQGEPFVGQAGKLLDNMLKALGLSRSEKVYIANVLRCRPGNRNPEPEEISKCEPFLRRQVQLLQPKIIVAMGRFAVQSLLGTTEAIGKLRGQRHAYAGVPVVVTYHPASLLRTLPDKAKAWADLCLAREIANTRS